MPSVKSSPLSTHERAAHKQTYKFLYHKITIYTKNWKIVGKFIKKAQNNKQKYLFFSQNKDMCYKVLHKIDTSKTKNTFGATL